MNKLALPIGVDDYKKMHEKNYYYVDKTLLIKELLDIMGEVNVFMRPRRFGKSLNLSMLKYFFEKTKEDNSVLFRDKKIWKCGEKYTAQQGKFPVIQISLKGTKTDNWTEMQESIRDIVCEEYLRHDYLLDSERLNKTEKKFFEIITDIERKFDNSLYKTSIKKLSKYLSKYYEEKAILLIDEYDVPLQTAYTNGFYKEAVNFISSFFQESMKDTGQSIEFAVITGCLRISRESIFTGFNNPKMISILSDSYAEHFGFEDHEVREILKYYNLENKIESVEQWYDGYKFGQTGILNPWSILNYVDELRANPNKLPKSYWANTSGNDIVRKLISKLSSNSKDKANEELIILMNGGTIKKELDLNIIYKDLDTKIDNIWNILFFTGYLTQDKVVREGRKDYYYLKIPNEEVKYIFETMISSWFEEFMQRKSFDKLYSAVLASDERTMTDEITEVLMNAISYHDYDETFYHGVMIGIFESMSGYDLKSNRESGKGRSDIILSPMVSTKPAIIMELKIAEKYNEVEKQCKKALKQIEEMKYDYDLRKDGYQNILKYGITFMGKECLVLTKE